MENFNNLQSIAAVVLIVDDTTKLDYPIYSITIINEGETEASVQGEVMPSGATWTFAAREGQAYPPDSFKIDRKLTVVRLLINK